MQPISLENKADIAAYLLAALEEGDPATVAAGLDDIAGSQVVNRFSQTDSSDLKSSQDAPIEEDAAELAHVLKVLQSLGVRFQVVPQA